MANTEEIALIRKLALYMVHVRKGKPVPIPRTRETVRIGPCTNALSEVMEHVTGHDFWVVYKKLIPFLLKHPNIRKEVFIFVKSKERGTALQALLEIAKVKDQVET